MSRTSGLMRSISSTRTPGRRSLTHERLHRHRLTGCHVATILLQHDQTISGPQGSGILSSMVTGNCLILLEEDRGDVAAGEAGAGGALVCEGCPAPRPG